MPFPAGIEDEEVVVRDDLAERVRVVEHVWIPLADGTRLAARLWLPLDAEEKPVPAVLVYLPYRKNDGTAAGDHLEMTYYAAHGYAGVRVDVRGSGDSDGIIKDEYSEQEQLDGVEAIAWIAEQPWCDGSVGMTGYSWGGFNSLQLAARRPPALKAVLSIYASDDRYADDVHYRGGCVIPMDMLQWGTSMLSFNALPPDPRFVEDWRDRWLERLERTPPFTETWLAHQRRDAYWMNGSVRDDYAAIRCPVYAVGGWTDGYTDAVLRLLEGLDVPCRGLIGPWGHNDPTHGVPSPRLGILPEAVRWWDRWLKGIENGIDEEPRLTVWLQDWAEPGARLAHRPGRWASQENWPSDRVETRALRLGPGTLGEGNPERSVERLLGLQSAGLDAGAWCADGHSADLPLDQRGEDGRSLTFDTEPLGAELEILGFADAVLEVEVDRPLALLFLRLCDVAPDGRALLVTRGWLNLTHREGHDRVVECVPGERMTVRVRLDGIAHLFGTGHRIRLGLSPTAWPLAWPSPEPVTLALHTGGESRLELPVRPDGGPAVPPLPGPEEPSAYPSTTVRSGLGARSLHTALDTGRTELRFDWDMGGLVRLDPSGTEVEYTSWSTYSIEEGKPLSARVECENGVLLRRDGWDTNVRAHGVMTSTATHFLVTHELEAFEAGARVWAKSWTFEIPRDGG